MQKQEEFVFRYEPASSTRILVIDDDPLFVKMIEKVASEKNIPVTVCRSFEEFIRLDNLKGYTAAIIDQNLGGSYSGVQVAELLNCFPDGEIPVVLVSSSHCSRLGLSRLPHCVKEFRHKLLGAQTILRRTLSVVHPS